MSLPKSSFVSETVLERKVKLEDGEEYLLYFREVSHIEFRRFFDAERSENEDTRIRAAARLISSSLCDPDGTLCLTMKEAILLKPVSAGSISKAVLQVCGFRDEDDKPKILPPDQMNGSGTSSHSPSEDGPSENSSLQ